MTPPDITVSHENGTRRIYVGITPRQAVTAAYAQDVRNDWNTWDYAANYDHMISEDNGMLTIGPLSTPAER